MKEKVDSVIKRIHIGAYSISTWYPSPYPAPYNHQPTLYICPVCLKYMQYSHNLPTHPCAGPPPASIVYQDAGCRVLEVDGKQHLLFVQNLCLLSKLFLDTKTVFFDLGHFIFYCLQTFHDGQWAFAGYFSKEKKSVDNNNLACILVLPPFRGQQLGQLLIELSYQITKRDQTTGGPEQPLSPQGFHSYQSFWRRCLIQTLLGRTPHSRRYLQQQDQRVFSLSRLSELTGIRAEDVLFTLNDLGLLHLWSGNHLVCISDECIQQKVDELRINLVGRMDPQCVQ